MLPVRNLHTLEMRFKDLQLSDKTNGILLQAIWMSKYLRRIDSKRWAENIVVVGLDSICIRIFEQIAYAIA